MICAMFFANKMLKVQHRAEEELEEYLCANQDKTDEILRRFAQLDTVLKSDQSLAEQIASINQLVSGASGSVRILPCTC